MRKVVRMSAMPMQLSGKLGSVMLNMVGLALGVKSVLGVE